jgi:tRNA(fMet)-specific endonuclease VapC
LFASFSIVLPFDSDQADRAGQIRFQLSSAGQNINDLDVLIAAAALSQGAVLVTKNTKHFQRITSLQVESV